METYSLLDVDNWAVIGTAKAGASGPRILVDTDGGKWIHKTTYSAKREVMGATLLGPLGFPTYRAVLIEPDGSGGVLIEHVESSGEWVLAPWENSYGTFPVAGVLAGVMTSWTLLDQAELIPSRAKRVRRSDWVRLYLYQIISGNSDVHEFNQLLVRPNQSVSDYRIVPIDHEFIKPHLSVEWDPPNRATRRAFEELDLDDTIEEGWAWLHTIQVPAEFQDRLTDVLSARESKLHDALLRR